MKDIENFIKKKKKGQYGRERWQYISEDEEQKLV